MNLAKQAMQDALDALRENHQWHQDYDDVGGYPGSNLEAQNVGAILLLQGQIDKAAASQGEIAGWRHSLTHTLHETEEEVQLADADSCAEPLFLGPPKDLEVQVEVLNNLLNTSLGMLADFALWCDCQGGGSLDDLYLQITKRDGPLRTKLDQALVDARARWAHLRQDPACTCGDRPASQCGEEWGPECDLGSNPKFVEIVKES